MLLILAALCTATIFHFQRYDMPLWMLLPVAAIPLGMTLFMGVLGLIAGGMYTGMIVRIDLSSLQNAGNGQLIR